ncbi:ThuA domain-containing protein [Blastococcus sp. SYSU D00820]
MGAVHLVTGGRWHDFPYAREQLHAELAARDAAVLDSPAWPEQPLPPGAVLVSYTCDLRPSPAAQRVLADFVAGGGRWLALHATNSVLEPPAPGEPRVFGTPRLLGEVARVLGSQVLGHPPIAPYRVEVTDPTHELVAGIEPFTVSDELYVCELHGPLEVLLHTRFTGRCPSYAEGDALDDEPRPVLYLRRYGDGEVVYLTLGHCRSLAELHELGRPDATEADRGSWETPAFRTVLGRCLDRVLAG